MSKRSTARHRATPAKGATLVALSQSVTQNAGSFGRQAAVVATASGLALTFVPQAEAAQAPTARETSVLPATGADLERASQSETVTVDSDAEIDLGRVQVTSTPAPEPEVEEDDADFSAVTSAEQFDSYSDDEQDTASSSESEDNDVETASAETPEAPENAASGAMGQVVSAAYSGVGTPYVWGGKTPAGWDCSGFTSWAYAQAGISIPSSTSAILGSGKFVRTSSPQPGDLVFQNGGGHVGIYVGNGQMIGAQNPSVGTLLHSVNRNPLMGYYTYVG
ncbi:C40 family peptidase [Auritidibacter ignavus]|uniref:C40 family peptidase n=1 Tax=Auritidibacter ignavus TaxID=678932 RepID=UPI0021080407|nr:C40 family peptidase [Auritidibacter ignavus]